MAHLARRGEHDEDEVGKGYERVHDARLARNVEMISGAQIVAPCRRMVGHVLGGHLADADHRSVVEWVTAGWRCAY